MSEMNAFERRLAAELEHIAGPERAVHARSIREAAQTRATRAWPAPTGRLLERLRERDASRSWLFRTAQLAAAVMVLALFGGLLLAGLLGSPDEAEPAAVTASPSRSVLAALPTDAVTEPIAPGIVRLLDDGAGHQHREWKGDELVELGGLHLGPDGQVWIVTTAGSDWYAWQVGVPGRHEPSASGFPGGSWWGPPVLASTPDGTLWAGGNHLASFDGEAWTRHDPRDTSGDPNEHFKFSRAISVQPDGTLWAAWYLDVGRLTPDGWDISGSYAPPYDYPGGDEACGYPFTDFTRRIVTLADGSLVAGGAGCLARFDGDSWQALPSPEFGVSPMADEIRTGGSGVLWAHINSADYGEPSEDHLARFDGEDWSVFPVSDGFNRLRTVGSSTVDPKWRVDHEGTAWLLADRVAADSDPDERRLWSFDGSEWRLRARDIEWFTIDSRGIVWTSGPGGTSYLDSEAWRRYPRVTGLFALDTADDGTAWGLGDEHSIYVIDPDAPTVNGGDADLPFPESGA